MIPVRQLNRGFTYTIRYRESPRSHLRELTGVYLGKTIFGAQFDLRPRAGHPVIIDPESIVEAFYGGALPAMLPRIIRE